MAAILAGTGIGAAVDSGTKSVAETLLDPSRTPFIPFVDLSLVYNRGVSFSLFATRNTTEAVLLGGVQAALILALFVWALRARGGLEAVALTAVLAGAVGNLLDRIPDGAVTDFLHLHALGRSFFTFNLADVWISAGVALLLVDALRRPTPPKTEDHLAARDA
ncbi:signal peptidase II [Enterovirga sp. DB1703]|uniref:Lipoprotein signal peptidase n=1 Tax=Enterovirga aerilata TaxID=2730920 RepID=A0A849I838_9HYPH|nr:signal peptidase II [Enterovirga sp. DB1703]NNM73944.1 signal peptidase II [Enterovirga sp. DB1703]